MAEVIWALDIPTPGTTDMTEVAMDARTGQIVALEKETAADEAKEKKSK